MNLLPFSLKVADGEVYWILHLIENRDFKNKSGYFAVSNPYRYSGEIVHSKSNDVIKAFHGTWKGDISFIDAINDEQEVINELSLHGFSINEDIQDSLLISDNFYRGFSEGHIKSF